MIKKILILVGLFLLSNCTIVSFNKGLNYEKTINYNFRHDKIFHDIINISDQKKNHLRIKFDPDSCGYYGLIGPFIFPIIPVLENYDCKNVKIEAFQAKKVHIIYNDKIYQPSKTVRGGGYFFPIPIKSITDTATLVVEKEDGTKFEIPFRYQHTFSFDLWPGR